MYAAAMQKRVDSTASSQAPAQRGPRRESGPSGEDSADRDQLLVVDDSASDRLLIRRMLADGATVGLKLVEAETAQDALELLRSHRVACMVIDQGLPDMTGLDLLNMLANIEPVGLVLISGGMDVALSRDAIRQGAHDVLAKDDLDPARLSLSIHAAVGSARVRAQMAEHAQRLELFFALADECRDYLFVVDMSTGYIVEANIEVRRITGTDRAEVHRGSLNAQRLFAAGPVGWQRLRASIEYYGHATVELEMFNGPGRRMPIEIRARRVTYGPRQYIICVGREVSRERGLAREVIRLRDPDLETGLPSADAFQAELDRCWNWAMNDDTALVLIVLAMADIAGQAGEATPDRLVQVGQALLGTVRRSNEFVGRLEDGRFAVIATGGDEVAARGLADRLRGQVRTASIHDPRSPVGHSLVNAGIAVGKPSDLGSVSEFIDLAQRALQIARSDENPSAVHLIAV